MAENDEILETGSSIVQRPVVLRSTSLEALGMQQKQQRRQDARSHPFFPRDWPVPVLDVLDIYERVGLPSGHSLEEICIPVSEKCRLTGPSPPVHFFHFR